MKKLIISTFLALTGASSFAVTGEMGTGVPNRIIFLNAPVHGANVTGIYPLTNASVGFPGACQSIWINQSSVGVDAYKTYTSVLLMARAASLPIRLKATIDHPTGGNPGCEADYVELVAQ